KFSSKGSIISYKEPRVILILSSKLYNLNADLKASENNVEIGSFKGFFKNTAFNISGSIDTTQKDNPLFSLNLDITTNPKDLAADLPDKFKDFINKFELDGLCDITGTLVASPANIRNWEMNLEVTAPELRLLNYRLEDLYVDVEQANKLLKIKKAAATVYNGKIELNILSNLAPADPAFNMEVSASNIDLSKLKQDIENWEEKDISGLFSLTAQAKGTLKDLNNLVSKGSASIKEGWLWELNLFKGLGEFLFTPSFKKVVFKEASADFEIENQVIYSKNALFKSQEMNLLAQGNIGFDKKLQLLITTEIHPKLLQSYRDPRRFTSFVTGNLLLVRAYGTLVEPRYHLSTVPQKMLDEIRDYFLGRKR
ncbi:MAG: AsmA-like C-terminal region-containing protein, partial [Candidatus Omnitrophica bacterium]|nr:AsmA-like C-terminal region-containing protein [Candidatus Omnitrophota bacterium]